MARGGARPGAGRKRTLAGRLARVPHRVRPRHDERHPMHVTVRCRPGLPSLRQQRVGKIVLRQMNRLNDERFQIVHHSIQTNHVHLVVEAKDRATITRKMAGFMISFAKLLNSRVLGRPKGKVWIDRYFRRDIEGSSDMYAVLRYVFGNAKKHGLIARDARVLDPYSSAWTFDGWDVELKPPLGLEHWPRPKPKTRLLRIDWIARGLIPLGAAPASR
jgi:REP element-mobilizing transposase RayT